MLNTDELIRRLDEQHATVMQSMSKNSDRLERLETRGLDLEQKLSGRRGSLGADQPQSLGAAVAASAELKTFQAQGRGLIKITVANAITSATGSAGALIAPDVRPEVVTMPRRPLRVRQLLQPGNTASNLVQFARQTVRTLNARPVTEGALKPESVIEYEQDEAKVRTIAHWVPASRQAIDDASQLQSLIDSDLRYGLDVEEEDQFLFGDGTGENLFGIVPQATAFAPPFVVDLPNDLDTILMAIAQVQLAGLPASGAVVNDMDWKRMQAIKDDSGQYFGAGPFGAAGNYAWQIPVVDSPAMPQGEFLVGAFALGAQVFDRMETEVLLSTEDRDNFVRNMVTVRAEKRLALAVKRPQAFVAGAFLGHTG